MDRVEIATLKKAFENDLPYVADEIREHLEIPSVTILTGDVGVGKTTFTKAFCPELDITSPTYAIISEYSDFLHGDLFRLNGPEEVLHLELGLYVENKKWIFFEWGIEHASMLYKLLGDDFVFYELNISTNKPTDSTANPSRNFNLSSIGGF